MTEEENIIEGEAEEIEHMFIIKKMRNGNCVVEPLDPAPDTLDQVYAACDAVQRNITAQHTASIVIQQMAAMSAAAQTNGRGGPNRTKGGLVVPSDIEVE